MGRPSNYLLFEKILAWKKTQEIILIGSNLVKLTFNIAGHLYTPERLSDANMLSCLYALGTPLASLTFV